MELLFTKSDLIGSKWIRKITGDPVSHCALLYGNIVIHASYSGVKMLTYSEFCKHSEIVHRLPVGGTCRTLLDIWMRYRDLPYDYPAFLFLGIRYLVKSIGLGLFKQNLWQSSGAFICSEFISSAITGKQDSLITPYQLYLKLKSLEKK